MEGFIMNFRGGRHTQSGNQMIILVKGIDSKEKANSLLSKKVTWSSPAEKEIKGIVKSAHGSKGAIRVLFEKGMPGQSIGQKVKIE